MVAAPFSGLDYQPCLEIYIPQESGHNSTSTWKLLFIKFKAKFYPPTQNSHTSLILLLELFLLIRPLSLISKPIPPTTVVRNPSQSSKHQIYILLHSCNPNFPPTPAALPKRFIFIAIIPDRCTEEGKDFVQKNIQCFLQHRNQNFIAVEVSAL